MAQRTKLPGSTYVKCAQCGKPFRVRLSALRRRFGLFCTRQCYRDLVRSAIAACAAKRNADLKKPA
jgi:hypothetical protein